MTNNTDIKCVKCKKRCPDYIDTDEIEQSLKKDGWYILNDKFNLPIRYCKTCSSKFREEINLIKADIKQQEKYYWELLNKIGWDPENSNILQIKYSILKYLSRDDIEYVLIHSIDLANELQSYLKTNSSSFKNEYIKKKHLIYDIIGFGEHAYNLVLKDPSQFFLIVNKYQHDPERSLIDALPVNDETHYFTHLRFGDRANKCLNMEKGLIYKTYSEDELNAAKTFIKILKLIDSFNFKEAFRFYDEFINAFNLLINSDKFFLQSQNKALDLINDIKIFMFTPELPDYSGIFPLTDGKVNLNLINQRSLN